MMQGWYYIESLTGQRHDRVQTESKELQPWTARSSKLWSNQVVDWYLQTHLMHMVMTLDEIQIQILAHWPMSHAKRVTRDNRKNPEYHVAAALRKLQTDTNCPAGKLWPNHVKKWPAYRIWKDLSVDQLITSQLATPCWRDPTRSKQLSTVISRKGQRTNQKYRNLVGSDQQMQRLEETELRKADRTVEVNCNIFSNISSATA